MNAERDERNLFEEWFASRAPARPTYWFTMADGRYIWAAVNDAWGAWQARAAIDSNLNERLQEQARLTLKYQEATREAEALVRELAGALTCAARFIRNGKEFGYIRMPESFFDTAHEALPQIDAALAKVPHG